MKPTRHSRLTELVTLAATLSGGSLFGGCETILWDAFVNGTKSYVLTGVLPSLVAPFTEVEDSTETDE